MRLFLIASLCLFAASSSVFAQDKPVESPKPKEQAKDPKTAPKSKPDPEKGTDTGAAKTGDKVTGVKPISLAFEQRKAATLFPIEIQGRRSYKLTVTRSLRSADKSQDPDTTNAVMDLILGTKETIDGKSHWVLEWRVNGETRQKEMMIFDEGRLLCRRRVFGPDKHARIFDIDAPQIILPAQAKPGQSWEWKGTTGKVAGATLSKIEREEEITIGMKKFQCVVVSIQYKGEDGSQGNTERWYSPKVGLVKETLKVTTQTESFESNIQLVVPAGPGESR